MLSKTSIIDIVNEMDTLGYSVLLFKDKGNFEINNDVIKIVKIIDDIDNLKLREKVTLLILSTSKLKNYEKITMHLMAGHKEVRIFNINVG
jgi:hypothetical protein